MAKTSKKKAMAKKQGQAIATNEMNFEDDAGRGIEQADADSFAVPFLVCLQQLSPQVQDDDDAKPGLLYNTVTGDLLEEALVIPVQFQRRFLRWQDREAGGGFMGTYTPSEVEALIESGEAERQEDGISIRIGDDQSLKDTRQHYVLMYDDDNDVWTPAILALSSTQVKKSKRWLSMINQFKLRNGEGKAYTPPSFARIYRVTTEKESNRKGQWYGLIIEPNDSKDNPQALVQDASVYAQAKEFYNQITSGAVNVRHEDLAEDQGAGENAGGF